MTAQTMNDIVRRIKDRRNSLGYSFQELADLTGMSKSTLQRYESGAIKNIPLDKLKILAEALKVQPEWIMGWEEEYKTKSSHIPVYGSVPAGIPIEAITDIEDWEDLAPDMLSGGEQYIALKVKGNSMYPKYIEGDTIIVKVQPDCESGQDAVVYVNGYDATLKKVVKMNEGIMLQPLNPEYTPQVYPFGKDAKISILGVVVELRRKV